MHFMVLWEAGGTIVNKCALFVMSKPVCHHAVSPLDAVSRYTGTAHSTDGAC